MLATIGNLGLPVEIAFTKLETGWLRFPKLEIGLTR